MTILYLPSVTLSVFLRINLWLSETVPNSRLSCTMVSSFGVVNVMLNFFRHVEEGSLEEHRIRVMFLLMGNINCHTDFAGIKEQTAKYGIGCYDVYDLKDEQWKDRIKTVLILKMWKARTTSTPVGGFSPQ